MPHKKKKIYENPHFLKNATIFLTVLVLVQLMFIVYFSRFSAKVTNNDPVISSKQIFNNCDSFRSKEQCYAKAFYELTQKNPISYSVSALHSLQDIDPQNSMGCHFIGHKISQAETEKDPASWTEVIKKIQINECTGGFLHGAIEAHLTTDPDFTVNDKTAQDICVNVINDKSFGERSCFHIMGHLMLAQYQADEFKAVPECQKFPLQTPQYECLSGAFMENLTREYLIAHGIAERLPWDLENSQQIEELCNKFNGLAQKACWKEISYMYWSIYKTDPKKLLEACRRAPDEDMATECFIYGAGNMVASYEFDFAKLPDVCKVFVSSDARYDQCNFQLVGSLVNTSSKNVPKIINLCANAYEQNKPVCFTYFNQLLSRTEQFRPYIKEVCASEPPGMKDELCTETN